MSAAEKLPGGITIASLEPLPLWVAWQQEMGENGRLTKVPYSPRGGLASTEQSSTWGTRAQAEDRAKTLPKPYGISGVGIVLGTDIGNGQVLAGVDLDTCRDPQTGAVTEWAADVISLLESYHETSPSMTGAKVFFTFDGADLPALRRKMGTAEWGKQFKRAGDEHPPAIELYLGRRYFCVTDLGNPDWFSEISNVATNTLIELITQVGPAFVAAGQNAMGNPPAGQRTAIGNLDKSRSANAFSIGRKVRRNGGSFEQMCDAIERDERTAGWFHEKGKANGGRELRRIWDKADTTWDEPVDFFSDGEISGAPILRNDHVPEALWPFITDTAERMGVDPSTVALGALVCCASVISDDWKIQPKRFDFTWTECPRLWGVIIGDPGILKSPVVSACTKPIDKLETEARKKHAEEMRVWRAQEAEAKMMKVAPPPQPKRNRFMVESATPEALSEVLRDDEDGKMRVPCGKVLVRQDEMSEFFAGLDKYKAGGKGGGERGTYLRLYNGGRYTIDRIGRGSFDVPNWSAGFFGGVQPGPIQKIASDAADDGMLQRFLKIVPDKQRGGLDRSPDQTALTRYAGLFPALVALQPAPAMGCEHVRPIVFHADAHEHREAINRLAVALAEMPDTSLRMKATFDKWPGTFARLCLTFHMIGIADCRVRGVQAPVAQVVSESTARQVADFMREIILRHEQRAEAVMFSTAQSGHARWIAGFILSRNMEQINTRDVIRSYRAFKAPEAARELEAVMASLVAIGWLEPVEPDNQVKRVSCWNVNPAVHVRFAERAGSEAKRREDARERIAEAVELIRKRRAA